MTILIAIAILAVGIGVAAIVGMILDPPEFR